MKNRNLIIVGLMLLGVFNMAAQEKVYKVASFDKIIVSPHIEVVFVAGNEESVKIENAKVSHDKINIEVKNKTLRLYLDDAKMVTKSKKVDNGKWKTKKSIYNGTMVRATVSYKHINNISIRGEEIAKCDSPIEQKELKISLYGDSKVYFKSVTLDALTVSIYGESYLEIASGNVESQVYRAYGKSEVNSFEVNSSRTKITAYGESNFRVNVSDKLKVTCYGEAKINYQGDAKVDKGIVIGEDQLRKIR